jgi:hypothetical protein
MALDILDNDPLLTERETAAVIGRTTRTLKRWPDLGEGPRHTQVIRRIFYRRSALREWLIACEVRP